MCNMIKSSFINQIVPIQTIDELMLCLYIPAAVLIILTHFICGFKLKVCVTLVIATLLEEENGIENIWLTTSDGFKDPPNYGKFIPVHYFRAFVCGFPHLWSEEEMWYSNNMPWESFKPFVDSFTQKWRDLVRTVYLLMDESMSAWQPKASLLEHLVKMAEREAGETERQDRNRRTGARATSGSSTKELGQCTAKT